MRIGPFDAAHDVAYGKTGKEPASSAALLNADDAYTRRTADSVVEGWVIGGQGVRPTQRHEDTIPTGRNVHQIRRRVIAHRADQAELVHYGITARINDGDVVAEPFADPNITIMLGLGCAVRV